MLYGADGARDWSKDHYSTLAPEDDWQTYLDLDSAVDYYLAREFTKDNDANFYRSNFFYTNNVDPNSVDPSDPNDRQTLPRAHLGLRSQRRRVHELSRAPASIPPAGGCVAAESRTRTRSRSTGTPASSRTRGS